MKNPKKGEFVVYYSARIGAPTRRLVGTIKEVVGRKCFVDFKTGEKYCLDRTTLVRTSYPVKAESPTPRTKWTFEVGKDCVKMSPLFTARRADIEARILAAKGVKFKKVMWREVAQE